MPQAKQEIREQIWNTMEEQKVVAFPFPPQGRIPNFRGAAKAADLFMQQPFWQDAATMKSNPDSPQKPVRARALKSGKRIFMAVPRLREEKPFREVIVDEQTDINKAVTIKGYMANGEPRSVEDMPKIDIVIAGSVAVHRDGRRVGKGGGYSDIEFALAREAGKITEDTLIVTTVHPLQVVEYDLPFEAHDVPLDYIITPDEVIATNTDYDRPEGIIREILTDKYLKEIPVLESN